MIKQRPLLDGSHLLSSALSNLRVDIDYIAALLEVPVADARALIDGLVYPNLDDPDELIPATTALSGNVREKYTQASIHGV